VKNVIKTDKIQSVCYYSSLFLFVHDFRLNYGMSGIRIGLEQFNEKTVLSLQMNRWGYVKILLYCV